MEAYEASALDHLATLLRKMARRLGAAPSEVSFGDSLAQAGARRVFDET